MRYFLMVLGIGAIGGAGLAGAVAVAVWPEPAVVYQVEVVERTVEPEPVETPVIDALLTDEDWQRIEADSDCLFDWLQAEVGWDITLDRVMAAGYWLDSLGGPCEVMGR